jgi:hypothetical protein
MYNTLATIACVLAGMIILVTIGMLLKSMWSERKQWREQDEEERKVWMKDYPDGWPKCPVCGRPALDGHTTCGHAECNEGAWR